MGVVPLFSSETESPLSVSLTFSFPSVCDLDPAQGKGEPTRGEEPGQGERERKSEREGERERKEVHTS